MEKTKKEQRQMLSSRIIKSLPVVSSVWGYGVDSYKLAKENALLGPGIYAAETIATPLTKTYQSLDNFASNQVDKATYVYDNLSTNNVLQAAAYPVGYAYGLTLGSMNAMENHVQGTRLEKPLEKLYDMAGAVVDGLLPAPVGEEADTGSVLRRKNPVRRIGKRASLRSIRSVPKNSIKFALNTTKMLTTMAAYKVADFGVSFWWNRATSSYRMAEKTISFLMQYTLIRSMVERPIPLLLQFADSNTWTKSLRHDGGALLIHAINMILTNLDRLHNSNLPKTSLAIEKLSLTLYNIQQFLQSDHKRRLSVFDDEDRLQKREKRTKLNMSTGLIEKAQSMVTPAIEKAQDMVEKAQEFVAPKTHAHKAHAAHKTPALATSGDMPIVNVKDAKTAVFNPFAKLAKNAEMTDDLVHVEPIHAHHKAQPKSHAQTEEKKEETHDDGLAARVAERAKHEIEMWKQQEIEKQQERERHHQEKLQKEREEHEEEIRKAKEADRKAKADRAAKYAELRAEEKMHAEQDAKLAQEKADNEAFEKEVAHLKTHQKYMEEKAIRDAKLAEKHKEVAYLKKKAEIERAVKVALEERERQWREEHADEIKAKEIGDSLIAQEEREKEREEKLKAKEAAAAERAETAAALKKEAAAAEKEAAEKEAAAAAAEKEAPAAAAAAAEHKPKAHHHHKKPAQQEIVVVGGHKVTDEVTHWSVATSNDDAWETVSHKKANHMSAEPILHPAPIKDAETKKTSDKNNEYFALNSQGVPNL